MKATRRCVPLLVVMAVLALVTSCSSGSQSHASSATRDSRPNVVIIETDDQTFEEMRVMPHTRELIGDQGTTFNLNLETYPLCCPSRTTLLTGQYSHNHGVVDNVWPNGGVNKFDATNSLATWLSNGGYQTSLVGKYLNRYGMAKPPDVPPGWTDWYGLIDPTTYQYYNFKVLDNGVVRQFGHAETDYSTDVLANAAVDRIQANAKTDQPLFLYLATLGPHTAKAEGDNSLSKSEAVPPERYRHTFDSATPPQNASINEADVSDKPPEVAKRLPISSGGSAVIAEEYRAELGALAAVDDAVQRVVQALSDAGELDNTYIMFTSDNGLFHGEHRIQLGKVYLYDVGVHTPLLIRGPSFPQGASVDIPVGNIDLAPTVVAVTGVTPKLTMDGRSLVPIANDPSSAGDRAVVLENDNHDPTFVRQTTAGVRTARYFYGEWSDGSVELYDYQVDPHELQNLAGRPEVAQLQASLKARLAALRACKGSACNQ